MVEFRPTIIAANKRRSELEGQLDEQGLGYSLKGVLMPWKYHGVRLNAAVSYDRVNLSNIPKQEGSGIFEVLSGFRISDTLSVSLMGFEATKKYYGPGGTVEDITN